MGVYHQVEMDSKQISITRMNNGNPERIDISFDYIDRWINLSVIYEEADLEKLSQHIGGV